MTGPVGGIGDDVGSPYCGDIGCPVGRFTGGRGLEGCVMKPWGWQGFCIELPYGGNSCCGMKGDCGWNWGCIGGAGCGAPTWTTMNVMGW